MLPKIQFHMLIVLSCILALVSSLAAQAPFQGVPPMQFQGVPSSGLGGANSVPGTRFNPGASQYPGSFLGCCSNFFLPSSFTPLVSITPQEPEHHHHHHKHGDELFGADPVYVPVVVPYAPDDTAGDSQDEADSMSNTPAEPARSGTGNGQTAAQSASGVETHDAAGDPVNTSVDDSASPDPDPESSEDAVTAQPSTVLIFKDGRRADVVNYAIVGDILFDFSGDRTHKILLADLDLPATQKANDALGVEFNLPPAGK